MNNSSYDVVIIGGGIQGVGVAQAATAEGYSVLLLEKTALASGTSSKSSKLIHGGLRYLESAEFSLVRECLNERKILLDIAPDLVKMKRFIIPVYRQTRRKAWQISTGLKLYYLLSNFRAPAKPGKIAQHKWDQLDGLNTTDLLKVFYYFDAQTDDKLLTQAVMQSAQSLGADLCMPARFISAEISDHNGEVIYEYQGTQRSCTARVIVNASGPWVNQVADSISPTPPKQNIELVAGTHIELEGQLASGIYYTESPKDGRAVFIMPWYGHMMVGTTERKYAGEPDQIASSRVENNYLLSVLRHYFPSYREATESDLKNSWAGLRVLPSGDGHAFHRTREVIYKMDRHNKPRVLSIYGGKLTAYRATALHVMDRIRPSLPSRKRRAHTDKLMLHLT